MAQNTVIHYTSDLSGNPIDTDTPTIQFGLDGTTYEIDLTDDEALTLRDALAEYTANGRRGTKATTRKTSPAKNSTNTADIRTWAEANGHDVPARGRIPKNVHDAYDAAH
ncbi:histone-like nucleoid-structuring protein Lsr2 [Solicola sp. PLA-1-18]|uniref:histone-like nucleoid-structuring protein Lsr2 n=1 Tax=Solicola sp. PLA-1-18 TaxID=3380532 RepID=UPI003B778799